MGRRFEWDIFLIAQDTHGTEDTFSAPDGLWADPYGRLFVGIDLDHPTEAVVLVLSRLNRSSPVFDPGAAGCDVQARSPRHVATPS